MVAKEPSFPEHQSKRPCAAVGRSQPPAGLGSTWGCWWPCWAGALHADPPVGCMVLGLSV